jgi:hypothetical protein
MRSWLPILLALAAVLVAGCRERAIRRYREEELLLWRAYCTNDLRGADAALMSWEELIRRNRSMFPPAGWSNALGVTEARRSLIHDRLGDTNGAERFMGQALVLLRETNVTRLVTIIQALDKTGDVRWRKTER